MAVCLWKGRSSFSSIKVGYKSEERMSWTATSAAGQMGRGAQFNFQHAKENDRAHARIPAIFAAHLVDRLRGYRRVGRPSGMYCYLSDLLL